MTSGSIALIAALAVLLLLSAFFSASETAYSSLNRVRLKNLAGEGNKKAGRALALVEDYDKLLSSVLVGNNIVNIVTSSLAVVLFVGFFGNAGVTISTVTVTVLVLLFGEISPKTLAKETPERFAMFAAPILKVVIVLLTPVNYLLGLWKRLIMRLFKVKPDRSISEQELLSYVEEARETGGINAAEEDMIRSAIEFDDLRAIDIYTPRVDIEAVAVDENPEKIAAVFHETGYSRLPVYKGSLDNIVGVLLEKDFHYYIEDLHQPLQQVMRPTLFIAKTAKIPELLGELQQKKTHMAVLVDEYGGTMGIVTIEDIVEELVGEIWDEHDDIEQEICKQPDGSYLVLGGTPLEDVFELFDIQQTSISVTVGGWAIEQLGRIPRVGDTFEAEGLRVTVEEMRRNRVGLLRVVALPKEVDPA